MNKMAIEKPSPNRLLRFCMLPYLSAKMDYAVKGRRQIVNSPDEGHGGLLDEEF